MLSEVSQNISRAPLKAVVPDGVTRVLHLEGDEASSLDLAVLQDLLSASPSLRVYVETYDPATGYYRLAILGKLRA
ncbi:MAG: hypothetical protein GXO73_10740 [Calditrichaeota bacterium]|nr:hypothetical protein [Calditrichota bacterium]